MSKLRNHLLNEVTNTVAYWISPKGEIVNVVNNHIDVVIKNPSKFGLTLDSIQSLYDYHHEPLGSEGKAREEIIIDLVKRGWIRVRRYRDGYSVNVARISNKQSKDNIFDWAVRLTSPSGILGTRERDIFMLVNIIGFVDGKQKSLTLKDIQVGELYEQIETFDINNCLIICESIEDVKDEMY